MSLFSRIMERLGLKKPEEKASATGSATGTVSGSTKPASTAPKPIAVSEVDVVKKLEGLAAEKPMKLNWKTSIADLLFLLDIENSYEARKELAVELGCPPELMGDSAKMNTWLHKEVLRQIAQNGGNIPKELLD